MNANASSPGSAARRPFWLWGVLWVVTYFGARALLELDSITGAARWGIALVPLPFFLAWLLQVRSVTRGLDELELRIQLEALAVAFPLTLVLLMTLGLLQSAGPLNPDDWSYRHLWPFMAMFYAAGLVIARRRYT